jgi:uncharacterized protein YlxW (UPF0749 family)
MMPWLKSGKFLVTVAAFALGIMFMTLLKANEAEGNTSARADTALPSLIQTEQENLQVKNDNTKLRQELAKFQEGQNASGLVIQQLASSQLNAGLTELKGPGIRIILDDSRTQERNEEDPYYYVIHEEYIRQIVNWLWNGGAEGISVNGQRIMGNTEIFCSGAFIQINQTRQMPPYIIEAVGDVNHLQSALQFYFWDRLGEYQQQYGITRKLEVPTEPLVIPAGQSQQFRYAEPVKGAQ